MPDDDEHALRTHIRYLLLEYAYTHLTVDHVHHSNTLVSEILPKILKPIPTHEPGEIVLLSDPFEVLKKKFKFDELSAYDEVWQPSPEAMQLLKETLAAPKRRSRTQTLWDEDDKFNYESIACRPMTPILSRSSRNKTPSLGKKAKKTPLASILSSHGLSIVASEDVPEEAVKLDDCLDVKLAVDASLYSGLVEYRRANSFLCRPPLRMPPTHVTEFLRSRSPAYEERFQPLSPPIFARGHQSRPSKAETENSILGRVKFASVEVKEVDPDIMTANMAVIEGWTTIPSSASTPSLSSGSSEVDELDGDADFWRPSSSVGEPTAIETIQAAKMEEPIFARTERPRGGKQAKVDEKSKQSLSSFISSRLRPNSTDRVLTSPNSDDVARTLSAPPPAAAISMSMLGQPPSESDMSSGPLSDSAGDTLDGDIRRMVKAHGGCGELKSYQDIIMHERLDEKESMFMDVPILSLPNAYLRNTSRRIQDRRATTACTSTGYILDVPEFASLITSKKVSGLKSLNLELSWRPFSFGAKIPTHAELIGVETLFSTDDIICNDQDETVTQEAIERFLAGLSFPAHVGDHPESMDCNDNMDLRFLRDTILDIDSSNLDARFNSNKDFDDGNAFLFSRSDRRSLAVHHLSQNSHDTACNEILAFGDSQPNATLDVSPAITPDFGPQFPGTQNAINADAFIDTHPCADSTQRLLNDLDYDSAYQTYNDMDDPRDKKKRRLTSAELDALCAVETPSLCYSCTINPKDLVLPSTDNTSYADEYNRPALPAVSVQTSQIISVLFESQSQSLSLSLNEDDPSQEFRNGNIANDSLKMAVEAYGTRCDHGGKLDILRHPVGVAWSTLPDSQEDISASAPDLERRQSVGEIETQTSEPARLLKSQQPDPDSSLGGYQGLLQPVTTGSQTNHDDLQVNKQEKMALLSRDNHSLSAFLQLRGRKVIVTACPPAPIFKTHSQPNNARSEVANIDNIRDDSSCQVYRSAPQDLLSDTRAFIVPDSLQPQTVEHTYLVSVDFVQYRAIVRALESRCYVRLVERDTVTPLTSTFTSAPISPKPYSADISIIVGPDAGVVFFPLSALPSQTAYKTLLDTLALYSWRFSSILLVLMAFPRSQLIRAASLDEVTKDGPSSYSPPALKAARRVRRDLGLREGTGEKRASCVIELTFADDVLQAAKSVRAFGDMAIRDNVVDLTHYIGEEEQEGERDIGELEGMNAFCAVVILRCYTLEEFLEMPPEQRTEGLADLVGRERIEHVNAILSKRMQAIDMDLPSSSELSSLN